MKLPFRILDEAPAERVISVDGAFDAPGLNLSHWPGNKTPAALKHDLSTGIALNFARLDEDEQRELAHGCTAIANNHFDTDGVCAAFSVRHPEQALPRSDRLLAAAAAGDLFRFQSADAFVVDAIVSGLTDPERSPWRDGLRGLEKRACQEYVLERLASELARILDGDVEAYRDLWVEELADARSDVKDLADARRDDIAHLDLCVFTAAADARSTRVHERSELFDPGRHALFEGSNADRVLSIAPREDGHTYRFLLSTLSWFELVTRRTAPRPRLAELAQALNRIEGTSPADECAWRCDGDMTPSPELWFGTSDAELFREHAHALRSSRLPPAEVRRAVADALRSTWTFPDA